MRGFNRLTMKKQTFVEGAWRRARGSRALRYGAMLAAIVLAGALFGRALSERGGGSGAASASVAAAPEAFAAQDGAGRDPGSPSGPGTTLTQVVDVPAAGPGFIEEIPNVDFTGLSPEQKKEAVRILNERPCNCNCQMNLAQCRRDDRSCPRSPEIVARFLAAIRKGDTPAQAAEKMYAGTVPAAGPAAPAAGQAPAGAQAAPAPSGKLLLFKVDPGSSPSVGPAKAPVTIVEFIDFQCPFCARADQTVKRIQQDYKDKVRVVFKQHPLTAIHPQATIASELALAAHEQGRYLQMHDRLFAAQRELGTWGAQARERALALAREIGLDADKVARALDSGKPRAAVEAESKQAEGVGATGTPAFFINGRFLSGARPYEQFQAIIDEELAGKRPPFEWATNVGQQRDRERAEAVKIQQQQEAEEARKVYTIDLKGAVSTGAAKAPVTIVEFTDFQCPFCQKVQPTLKQLLQDYKGRVRLVTKNLPLAFHPQARPAARAALAANKQGKYWEYRDLLFANNRNLAEDQLLAHASALGLNLERFKTDMNSPEIDQMVAADEKQAQEIGANGTPTFLINGRKLVGAQPLEAFKQRVEAELSAPGAGKTSSLGR